MAWCRLGELSSIGEDRNAQDHYRMFLDITEGAPQYEALRERTVLYLRQYPPLMPLAYHDLLVRRIERFTP